MSSFQSARTARPAAARSNRKSHRTRLWLRPLEERIAPANLVVTSSADSGTGSLRAILATANSNGQDDTITFDPSVTTINLTTGGLSIFASESVVINGGGKVTINGAATASTTNRIFGVTSTQSPTVTLQGLTLAHGNVTGDGGAISCNFSKTTAQLTLTNCNVLSSTASGNGGGLAFTKGLLSISDCKFDHDSSGQTGSFTRGGGIFVSGSVTAAINRCTISNNISPSSVGYASGGGIYAGGCHVDLTDCSIINNVVQYIYGGGCEFESSTVTLTNCTVAGNSAGSIAYGGAGGLDFTGSPATLTNCTITGNWGRSFGGGMYLGGPTVIRNSTIVGNTSVSGYPVAGGVYSSYSTISVESSIIAGNSPADLSNSGVTYSGNNNFIGDGTPISGTNNQKGANGVRLDPQLFPLANNGGLTQTMAPHYNSPVLDKGANPANLQFDQRGQPRVVNGSADIGAVEGAASLPFLVKFVGAIPSSPDWMGYATPGTTPFTVSVTYDSPIGIDTSTFDANDISVTGPYMVGPITFSGYSVSGNKVTATYLVSPPGGSWTEFNLGTYTVTYNGGQVSDISNPANFVTGQMAYGRFANATPGKYVVDSVADTVDGNYGPGQFTLREAVQLANVNIGTNDTISFNPSVFSNPTTIVLESELNISGSTTIYGPGAGLLTLSGNNSHRIIKATHYNPFVVTIRGLTFANGVAGDDLSSSAGRGGAIYSTAQMTLMDCILSNNSATSYGGAVYGNTLGVYPISLVNCALVNNTAGYGGALYAGGGIAIINSTLSGNAATVSGGAIFSAGSYSAQNSTITGNSAATSGGGIAGKNNYVTLSSTIVAGNLNANTPDLAFETAVNILGDNNLIGAADSGNVTLTGTGNLTGTLASPLDPMLFPLANNGGPTPMHALKVGSPAIDNGNNAANLTNDQRGTGFPRTIGVKTDIGAYEFLPPAPTVTGVTFGDGTNQRSLVRQIVVTFSEAVNFMGSVASAFTLHRTGTGGVIGDVTLTANPVNGPASSVTITFVGSLTEFGSLVDGKYDFTIDAAQVSGVGGALDGNSDGTPGGSYFVNGTAANRFYRLFGDSNGDGVVGQTVDMVAFKNAFGFSSSIFDFDNNGVVDQKADFVKFKNNFGMTP